MEQTQPKSKGKAIVVAAANHHHPYRRPGKEPVRTDSMEEVNSYDTPRIRGGGENSTSRQYHFQKYPQYYNDENLVLPAEFTDDNFHIMTQTQTQTLTMDLLGEWKPLCGLENDVDGSQAAAGTSSARPIYLTEEEIRLQIGPTTSNTEYLDLELKLGF